MNRRKFLRGAAVACAAVAVPSAVLGLALKKEPFIASGKITFNKNLIQRETTKVAALAFEYGTKGEYRQLFPEGGVFTIDGFYLEEGERVLITGSARVRNNGVYEVTKSSLAAAAMRGNKDLVDGVTKQLLETNRLLESIPFKAVEPNQSHLVYDRHHRSFIDWKLSKNKTVEANDENDMRFYDENGKEQPFPRAVTCVKPDPVTARIEELMLRADRPENAFFPRSPLTFVPAPKENEYA